MRMRRLFCVLLTVALAAPAMGQDAPPPPMPETRPAFPDIEPVLKHLPADAAGFLVVNSVQALSDDFQAFVEALDAPVPMRGTLAEMIQGGLQLGEGFNPTGGLAIAMLDPAAFDVDVFELMGAKSAFGGPESMPVDDEPDTMPGNDDPQLPLAASLPMVIFLPAESVESIFGHLTLTPEGDATRLEMAPGGMVMFAQATGDYVALSPRLDALNAALSFEKSAATTLAAGQLSRLADADVAMHMNMAVSGPIIKQGIEMFSGMMNDMTALAATDPDAPQPPMDMDAIMSGYVRFYGDLVDQTDSVTLCMDVGEAGLTVDELVNFKADSAWGKMLAVQKPSNKPLLNRLPSLPYVLAVGADVSYSAEMAALAQSMSEAFLSDPTLRAKLPEDALARSLEMSKEFYQNISSMQMVLGGMPEGTPGAIGMAFVYECADASAVRTLTAEQAQLQEDVVNAMLAAETPEDEWAFEYETDALSVAGQSVDRMRIGLPESMMQPEVVDVLNVLFGQEELELLAATPTNETFVMTFGGGQAMLGEALKTAGGTGPIASAPVVAETIAKAVPDDAWGVGVLSVKHLGDVVAAALEANEPGSAEYFPLKYMETDTPVVFFMRNEGPLLHGGLHVPAQTMRDAMLSSRQVSGEQVQAMMEEMEEAAEDAETAPADEGEPTEEPGF